MLLQHPFEVVTTAVDGAVLQVLAGADTWFTIAQVWQLSGVRSRDQVRRVLARLAETGILDAEQVATTFRYRMNRDHLAAGAIIEIATTRQRLLERLRQELASWSPQLAYAALFGSAARGDMGKGSDLDLLLVRPDSPVIGEEQDEVWENRIQAFEELVGRWTGNPVNVLHLRESDLQVAGNADALAVIRSEGIPLVGDRLWLIQRLSVQNQKVASSSTARG